MYSAVPPPQSVESNAESDDENASQKQAKLNTTNGVASLRASGAPAGVSHDKWKKFQELRERRAKCCQSKTVEKRIKRLKKDVTKTVFSEMKHPDEIAVLEDHGLTSPKLHKLQQQKTRAKTNVSETRPENEVKWKQLIQYSSAGSQCSAKTEEDNISKRLRKEKQLEEQLENAIKQGNLDEAESISKQLVEEDFASKLVRAVECRDYVKRKVAEEEKMKKKKKAKLHWGFEQKQRWESKGNM